MEVTWVLHIDEIGIHEGCYILLGVRKYMYTVQQRFGALRLKTD